MSVLSPIKITVSGPGLAINFEVELIRKALEDAGISVEVENDHPAEDPGAFIEHRKSLIAEQGNKPNQVVLIADHLLWGG